MVVIGYCRNCKKSVELKNVEIKSMKNRPLDYYLGSCPRCNRKISLIKGKNDTDKINKLRLEITNKHISQIEETKIADFINNLNFDIYNTSQTEQMHLGIIVSAFKNYLKNKLIKN